MDQNQLSSNVLNFSDLDHKYRVFRDPNGDFKMSMEVEFRRLAGEIYSIERRYKEDRFLGDEVIDIKYKTDLCGRQIRMLQIELSNCIFILEKFKEVNVNYGGEEIKIHFRTHQIDVNYNFIELHRNGCREFANMIEKESRVDKISNSNYSTLPGNDQTVYDNLRKELLHDGLVLDRAKDYCGHCLSQVDIDLATQDFFRLKLQISNKIVEQENYLERLKIQKIHIEENRKLKLDAMPNQRLRDEIPENQLVVARQYKKEILDRNSTLRIRHYFGGFKQLDGKLFVGTGYEKWTGEDLCIEYSNWILIDANGSVVESINMIAEELEWSQNTILDGPGGGHPISIN
jgi:hypothetical protein